MKGVDGMDFKSRLWGRHVEAFGRVHWHLAFVIGFWSDMLLHWMDEDHQSRA